MFLILRRTSEINAPRAACKVHVTHSRFLNVLNFLVRYSKYTQISEVMKIRPVGVGLPHADGQTKMNMLIIAFCNFANALNNKPDHKPKNFRH
jgi:hypothetical protein